MKIVLLILSICSVIALEKDPSSDSSLLTLLASHKKDPSSDSSLLTHHRKKTISTRAHEVENKWHRQRNGRKCHGGGRRANSLAEFATTTAMMATMATVANPRFSPVGMMARQHKTKSNIDLIVQAGSNFFNNKATTEGHGRFPGQPHYDEKFPSTGYNNKNDLENELDLFSRFDDPAGSAWASVFGIDTDCAWPPDGSHINPEDAASEWIQAFGGDVLQSPFQDGHYIFTVIPPIHHSPPILYVADLENPSQFIQSSIDYI